MRAAIMSYLLTAVLVLSGLVVQVLSSNFTCQERIVASDGQSSGNGVTMRANCYPNGTVSYSWNSSSITWKLQIEYQCYNNGTTHEQTPNPATELRWSDIIRKDGDGMLNNVWQEGTSCILSGCYQNSQERNHPTHGIPEATCTVHTTHAVVTSSPALPMASILLLPTTTHLTPSPSPSHTPALPTPLPPVDTVPHLTPSPSPSHTPVLSTPLPPVNTVPHLTPSLTTQSLSHTYTPTTIEPDILKTELLVGITVAVLAVLIALLGLVAALGFIAVHKKRQPRYPPIISDKKLDSKYSPVSPEEGKRQIMESIETIFTSWIDLDLVNYDKPPRTYIKQTSSSNHIATCLDQGKVHNALYQRDSGIVDFDLILVPKTEEGVKVEEMVEKVNEKEEEEKEEEERLEVVTEEDERDDPHRTRSQAGYVTLESIKHSPNVPEDELTENSLQFTILPETSPEFCNDGALQSVLHYGNSSGSSGYVSDQSLLLNRPVALSSS